MTLQLDGTLAFASDDLHIEKYMNDFPRDSSGHVFECLHFINGVNLTFTSSMEVRACNARAYEFCCCCSASTQPPQIYTKHRKSERLALLDRLNSSH